MNLHRACPAKTGHKFIFISFLLLVQKETSLSGKNWKEMKKFQKPKSCRQLP